MFSQRHKSSFNSYLVLFYGQFWVPENCFLMIINHRPRSSLFGLQTDVLIDRRFWDVCGIFFVPSLEKVSSKSSQEGIRTRNALKFAGKHTLRWLNVHSREPIDRYIRLSRHSIHFLIFSLFWNLYLFIGIGLKWSKLFFFSQLFLKCKEWVED